MSNVQHNRVYSGGNAYNEYNEYTCVSWLNMNVDAVDVADQREGG
jgi:hypothetical protein